MCFSNIGTENFVIEICRQDASGHVYLSEMCVTECRVYYSLTKICFNLVLLHIFHPLGYTLPTNLENAQTQHLQVMTLILLPDKLLQKPLRVLLARPHALLPRPLLVIRSLRELLKVHHSLGVGEDEPAALIDKVTCSCVSCVFPTPSTDLGVDFILYRRWGVSFL